MITMHRKSITTGVVKVSASEQTGTINYVNEVYMCTNVTSVVCSFLVHDDVCIARTERFEVVVSCNELYSILKRKKK